MADITDALAAAGTVVTGPDTPSSVTAVQKPDNRLVWALIGAGPALCMLLSAIVWILAFRPWPMTVTPSIVHALAFIAYGLLACLGLVVWRLAGSRKMEVRAGPASLMVDA